MSITITVDDIDRAIECDRCLHWESNGVDEPPSHIYSFTQSRDEQLSLITIICTQCQNEDTLPLTELYEGTDHELS